MAKPPFSDTQIMITLASIAYAGWEVEIASELKKSDYATQGQWILGWGPHDSFDLAYRMFVVQNHANPSQYAVVIRGSVLTWTNPVATIFDWFNDLEVGTLDAFSNDSTQGLIARGTKKGMDALADLPALPSSSAPKFKHYIEGLPSDAEIFVTGHSLGGTQASVIAPWIRNLRSSGVIKACTFAAPTPGDQTFATFAVEAAEFHRVWNQWDFIPHAFAPNGLATVGSWYPDPGPQMSTLDRWLYDEIKSFPPSPNPYVQPAGDGTELTHQVTYKIHSFFTEVGHQHSHNTYLQLRGLNYTIT